MFQCSLSKFCLSQTETHIYIYAIYFIMFGLAAQLYFKVRRAHHRSRHVISFPTTPGVIMTLIAPLWVWEYQYQVTTSSARCTINPKVQTRPRSKSSICSVFTYTHMLLGMQNHTSPMQMCRITLSPTPKKIRPRLSVWSSTFVSTKCQWRGYSIHVCVKVSIN